jgi:hypothetical protein
VAEQIEEHERKRTVLPSNPWYFGGSLDLLLGMHDWHSKASFWRVCNTRMETNTRRVPSTPSVKTSATMSFVIINSLDRMWHAGANVSCNRKHEPANLCQGDGIASRDRQVDQLLALEQPLPTKIWASG